jgi:hypothetical protein
MNFREFSSIFKHLLDRDYDQMVIEMSAGAAVDLLQFRALWGRNRCPGPSFPSTHRPALERRRPRIIAPKIPGSYRSAMSPRGVE